MTTVAIGERSKWEVAGIMEPGNVRLVYLGLHSSLFRSFLQPITGPDAKLARNQKAVIYAHNATENAIKKSRDNSSPKVGEEFLSLLLLTNRMLPEEIQHSHEKSVEAISSNATLFDDSGLIRNSLLALPHLIDNLSEYVENEQLLDDTMQSLYFLKALLFVACEKEVETIPTLD